MSRENYGGENFERMKRPKSYTLPCIKVGTVLQVRGYVPQSPTMVVRAQVDSIVDQGTGKRYEATVHDGPNTLRRKISFLDAEVTISGKGVIGNPQNFTPVGGRV